ncbi:unnamed protein product [Dimorphilus gyrociliatus]|uniref:RING-type domain-containing protein n=1 Tax=Dimorphilus gyrociliatus TaxID=2664684 RepID=A0A7I8VG02_9ANNE|nr:unnamed protein product [Dimorphilus gyrociliatus]
MSDRYTINKSELVCAICVESWVERDPRTLPCQHTFCLGCLKQLKTSHSIECPICRRKVNVPNRDVSFFPKSLLLSAIEKTRTEDELCSDHQKQAFKPLLSCKTCMKTNLCNDCLEQDHSGDRCCIVTLSSLQNGMASFQNKFKALIDKQREKDKRAQHLLVTEIDRVNSDCRSKIDSYFDTMRRKLKKYFDKKDKKLKFSANENEFLFLNEKEIEKRMTILLKEPLPVIDSPTISYSNIINFSLCQNMVDTSQKSLVKVKEHDFVIDHVNSFSVSCEGFYYTMNNQLDILYYKPSPTADVAPIFLDREVGNFVVTTNFMYAIDHGTGLLLNAKKPFGHRITLELFDLTKACALRALEDTHGQRYLMSHLPDVKECKFFVHDHFEWSFSECKDLGCLLHNGYPLVRTTSDKLVILDKYSGVPIRSVDCPQYSVQHDISPYGLLMTSETIVNESWMGLFLFDYNLNMIRNIDKFINCSILGTTTDGTVAIYSFEHKLQYFEFQ